MQPHVNQGGGGYRTNNRAVGRSENPGVPVLFGGPPLVETRLTDLPNSGGAMAPTAPPGTTPLISTETISSTEAYGKIDCEQNPNHSWCLNSYGKECETYDEVTEKPVKSNHEKELLLGLHNEDRKKVYVLFTYFFINVFGISSVNLGIWRSLN